ncbi:MAG: hypothetical protein MJ093_00875 [Saccharofermentans sp.]|nr:hypothetical protein [Saccharofermentans sp.]
MKKGLVKLVSVVLGMTFVLSACKSSGDNKYSEKLLKRSSTLTTDVVAEIHKIFQVYSLKISDDRKPEVIGVSISGKSSENIDSLVTINNIYGENYYHSGVVGLVGVPVEIEYEKIDDPKLRFFYDLDEFRGIPVENIMVLKCLEDGGLYQEVTEFELDTTKQIVTISLSENEEYGVYVLVDKSQWFGDSTIDVTEYDSDWERQCDTGSIMNLVDKDWAINNAPDFMVSNPTELASVVYYVNAVATYPETITVTLTDDIDLAGYRWVPMGWYDFDNHGFSGVVDGNGHTISRMNIIDGYNDAGFIGYGMNVTMKNITFTDANVNGVSYGCMGIAGGEIYGSSIWENVHVQGQVVYGSEDHGGIVGRETNITFEDCTASVVMDGEEYDYLSFRQYYLSQAEVEETFTLTLNDDYSITRDDHEGFVNLGWDIQLDGVTILSRNAEDEYVLTPDLQWVNGTQGRHTIYLTAYDGTTYVRVSNIIEYTID